MSATIIGSAAVALATAATVAVAANPEAKAIFSPLTEGSGEFSLTACALLFSFPILAVLTVLAGSSRD